MSADTGPAVGTRRPADRSGSQPGRRPGPARRPASRRRRQFVPPQHGAWAMLIVPYLAALLVAGATWVHLPLFGAWLAGYLLSYYVFQAVKSRRPRRYRNQLLLYAALTLPLLAVVVWARPAVLGYAPVYALLLAVNAAYAWLRRERALLNDLASVVQSCLMVFVAATVAGAAVGDAVGAFLVVLAYFTGTTLYIKTMIRERGNPVYLRWSVGYHLAAFGLAAWLGPAPGVLFAWLLLRAWLLPRYRITPKQSGFIEIGNCLLLVAAAWSTWAV